MAGFTYSTLKDAILQWCGEEDGDELSDNIDTIMMIAQARVQRDLEVDFFVNTSSGATVTNDVNLSLPSDYLEMSSIYVVNGTERIFLMHRSNGFIEDFNSNTAYADVPKYWGIDTSSAIVLAPKPNASYSFKMRYHARISPLSASNTTNWIATNAPDLLLYACLEESEVFMHEGQQGRTAMWQGKYASSLINIKDEIASMAKTGTERLTVTPILTPPVEVANERTA